MCERVCVGVHVCVCEKRERVWVYVGVMVWACLDLALKFPSLFYIIHTGTVAAA